MQDKSKVTSTALRILGFMVDNGLLSGKSMTVRGLIESTGIPEEEYDLADTYLLQQGYIKGTMGGKAGSRWLTGDGIEFYEDRVLSAKATESGDTTILPDSPAMSNASRGKTMPDPSKVFVVHGRDECLRKDFFSFLRALGLQPLEWSEALKLTGKAAPYIGEVLDSAFDNAQAVIVLLTPDDEVRLLPELCQPEEDAIEKEYRLQARPNVLFEAGMALCRNTDRTLLVQVGRVKPFSDIAGRHVIRLTNDVQKRKDVAERLSTAGCAVSMAGKDWLNEGNLSVTRNTATSVSEVPTEDQSVKWVDLQYPHDSGLQAELESQGYLIRWCAENRLARLLDIEGWTLATQTTPSGRDVVLKVKDRPYNQTLIKKPVAKTIASPPTESAQRATWLKLYQKIGAPGVGSGEFRFGGGSDANAGIFVDDNYLYVTDWNNDRLQRFVLSLDNSWVYFDCISDSANLFSAVYVDKNGTMFLQGMGLLRKYDTDKNPLGDIKIDTSNFCRFVVDREGNIFAQSGSEPNLINKYDAKGSMLVSFGGFGSSDGKFNNAGWSADIIADTTGNIYMLDSGGSRVQKSDNHGNFLKKWHVNIEGHSYMAIDENDRIYVVENGYTLLNQYSTEGALIQQYRIPQGIVSGGASYIFVKKNLFFVSNHFNHDIKVFSLH